MIVSSPVIIISNINNDIKIKNNKRNTERTHAEIPDIQPEKELGRSVSVVWFAPVEIFQNVGFTFTELLCWERCSNVLKFTADPPWFGSHILKPERGERREEWGATGSCQPLRNVSPAGSTHHDDQKNSPEMSSLIFILQTADCLHIKTAGLQEITTQ